MGKNILIFALFVCAWPSYGFGNITYMEKSLRGAESVIVHAPYFNKEEEQAGWNAALVKTGVELKLQQLGVRVVGLGPNDIESLHLDVILEPLVVNRDTKGNPTVYAVKTGIRVSQLVQKTIAPSSRLWAITWLAGDISIIEAEELTTVQFEILLEFINEFASDYSQANSP